MKPKTLILMVVAVVCGLGASYMTSRLLAERDEKAPEQRPIEKIRILVAKKNVEMHTALKKKPEDFFTEKEVVKDDAPKEALVKEDLVKLKDKFLKRGLRKGDHVTPDDLMDKAASLYLPNGMRAVGLRVSPEQVASGFACVPGSHVDIIWTRRVGGDTDTFAKTLLRDVIVLAADINDRVGEGGGAMLASVVTVALSDLDARKITLAMDTGSLRLILRNLEDRSTDDQDTITVAQLLKAKDDKLEKNPEPAPTPETNPEPKPRDTPMKEKEPEPRPLPKLTKRTVTVRNNGDVQIRHYWVDEQDNIITNPQQYLEQFEDGTLPAPNPKKDEGKPKKLTPEI